MPRVLVWPADNQGSGFYRLRYPALTLAGDGYDVDIDETGPRLIWDTDWSSLDHAPDDAHVIGLDTRPDADIVVLQRPGRAHWSEAIPHLHSAGIRVVVDIDDDFWSISKQNVAYRNYDPATNRRHSHEWIRRACDLADLVTVSTAPLTRAIHHDRVRVLPNLVPDHYLSIQADKHERSIGWAGSVETHPGDLEVTSGAVGRVCAESGWHTHVIGTGRGVAQRLRVPEVNATGRWLAFGEYPAALAELEIGIVPLADTRFNRAKSALKLAEMSAVGVPTVASPTPDNIRLHEQGVGLLARSPADWRRQLSALVTSDDYRAEITHRSREAMRTQTYGQWAELWAHAWESTLSGRAAA